MNQPRSAQGNQATAVLKKANPFRSDISWQMVLIQGIAAVAIGLYALLAEESARQTVVFLIGLFLLVNGLLMAWAGLHNRWKAREIAPGRVGVVTLILIGLGVLGTFPPVWGLL